MSIFDITSYNSLRRGFEYYESKRVLELIKVNDSEYDAIVSNCENHEYNVHFNTKHPRKSTCNCPHAEGRMIICKHEISVFFEIFPIEAKRFKEAIEVQEKEEEVRYQEHLRKQAERYAEVKAYVDQLPLDVMKVNLIHFMKSEYDNNDNEDEFDTFY